MQNYYCVMTFHTTYHALNFEKLLKENNIKVRLMPIPRHLSSSCGTAAEFACEKEEEILEICHRFHIEIDQAHQVLKESKNNWFLKFLNSL